MEQSAYEALMIGVNAFVFIIALTAGILLMSNVSDMVNYANENAIRGMNGTLAESVGIVHERIYSGEQLLAYYRKMIDETSEYKYDYTVKTSSSGAEKSLKSFVESQSIYQYLDREFELQYKGVSGDKETYVFIQK